MKQFYCPNCEFHHSQLPKFEFHLREIHGVSDIIQYYIDTFLCGIKPTCACGCGEQPKFVSWVVGFSRVIRGHNAKFDSCFSDPQIAKHLAEKRKEAYQSGQRKVWNDGLTKETSETVRSATQKSGATLKSKHESGELISWQTGLTKENNTSLLKGSETRKRKFKNGEISIWSQSLTKATSPLLAQTAEKISKAKTGKSKLLFADVKSRVENAGFELLSEPQDYVSRRVAKLRIKCPICMSELEKSLAMIEESGVCYVCHPQQSKGQLEIFEFIKSLSPNAINSDWSQISPQELDIFVPSKKIAFEYNGLYYHSSHFKTSEYHADKMRVCQSKGISLINIFEDDWTFRRPIVESMIRHQLGFSQRIGARKCKIVLIDKKVRSEFFAANHIDGDTAAKIAWGLYHDDVLVSAISLRTPKYNQYPGRLEVARYCSLVNTVVSGGLSRLTKQAIQYCRSGDFLGLMTYTDLRVGSGYGWTQSGWKLIGQTAPRMWWTDSKIRVHRLQFRADTKTNETQVQVAAKSGFYQIYGCPNQILIKDC